MNISDNIGIDGVHCTIILNKQEFNDFHIDKNLKNSDGSVYGSVKSYGENIKLRFNIPLMIRENNIQPFSINDTKQIPYIKVKLLNDLNKIFGTKIKAIIPNAIEVNVTKKVENCSVSDMLKLIKLAYLDKVKQTATWELKSDNMYSIRSVGMLTYNIVNEYRLKCYDKSEQYNSKLDSVAKQWEIKNSGKSVENQWEKSGKLEKVVNQWQIRKSGKLAKSKNNKKKNKFKFDEDGKVESNILRIEMIMQGRRIRQTYGRNCQLFDILDDLPKMVYLFISKYNNEVVKRIKKYLNTLKMEMFEEMTQGYSYDDVIKKYITVLVDAKQIQAMLSRYYQFKGYPDQSIQLTKKINKKYKLNTVCIQQLLNILED